MFVKKVEPSFNDIDAMGHVNNTKVLSWFSLCLNDVFKLFTPDLDTNKWRLIMAKVEVDYHEEIRLGQEVEITTYISKIGSSSFTVTQEAYQNGRVVCVGKSVLVHFDHSKKEKMEITGALRNRLSGHFLDKT